ncbi:glycosyltransferase [Pseudokineococcus basanitobsidens]|uniref:Glycosyltransferase n=1 Tax=Pseudokineococcus basanitobsidens TaxID=1926649 RepID=A0ABU8RJR4_9ACTN
MTEPPHHRRPHAGRPAGDRLGPPAHEADGADGAPEIAVVIAVHDVEQYVAETMDSLLAQTWPRWSCVVVDDGSRDGTAEALAPYLHDQRVRLLQQPQAGSAAARNAGLAAVAPEVPLVAFLDGDDTWLPDALERLADALLADPRAVGAYGLAEYMDEASRPVRVGEHPWRQRDRRRMRGHRIASVPRGEDTDFGVLLVSGPIWPSAVALHRHDVVRRVGGFDERLRLQQDWDLYIRQSRSGHFTVLDEQVAWYRQHGTNVTHRTVQRVYFQDAVRRKTWADAANSAAQRHEAVRAWRALQARRVLASARRGRAALERRDRRATAHSLRATLTLCAQMLGSRPPLPDADAIARTGRAL